MVEQVIQEGEGYWSFAKKSFGIAQLDTDTIIGISQNPRATEYGIITLALLGVAYGIGTLNPLVLIIAPPVIVISFIIVASIYHVLAMILGGKASATQYFRAYSNSQVINWVLAIPILGWIILLPINLWMIIVNIKILEEVHKLSKIKAIIVGLTPTIISISISLFLFLNSTPSEPPTGYAGFGYIKPESHQSPISGTLILTLKNTADSPLKNITVRLGGVTASLTKDQVWPGETFEAKITQSVNICPGNTERYDVLVEINYTNTITGLKHISNGRIMGLCSETDNMNLQTTTTSTIQSQFSSNKQYNTIEINPEYRLTLYKPMLSSTTYICLTSESHNGLKDNIRQEGDLALDEISDIADLQCLTLINTEISDISSLAKLSDLRILDLWNTSVTDIKPLAKLTNLEYLVLDGTNVRDLTPLSNLSNLKILDIDYTPVTDVKALYKLKNLRELHISCADNRITKEQYLELKQNLPDAVIYCYWASVSTENTTQEDALSLAFDNPININPPQTPIQ